jgi:hypothetical protein
MLPVTKTRPISGQRLPGANSGQDHRRGSWRGVLLIPAAYVADRGDLVWLGTLQVERGISQIHLIQAKVGREDVAEFAALKPGHDPC